MRTGELVKANKREAKQEMIAPSLKVPILPSIDMMGEPDRAPVIDPSVNTATINPNFDDYRQHSPPSFITKTYSHVDTSVQIAQSKFEHHPI